jgi:hypothetical protein
MQNGYIESFNGRMRDELLNETQFIDLSHARRSGLSAVNYIFVQGAGNATALTINQGQTTRPANSILRRLLPA